MSDIPSRRHTHAHTHAHSVTIPLALIFQQRHSIRQRPCHRLLPGDPDPGSPRLVFTLQHHHQDRGKHSADLKAELALCPPFPGAPSPPFHQLPSYPLHHPCCCCHLKGGAGGVVDGRMLGGNGNKRSKRERERDTERGCVGGLWGAD